MGNYTSKLLYTNESPKPNEPNEHQDVQQIITEDNTMFTPVLPARKILVDPRSVSAGIKRTPIEVKCTPVNKVIFNNIPKYLQKKQYLETNMDVVMPPLTPKKSIPKIINDDQHLKFDENYLTSNANVAKVITSIDKERFMILGLDPRSPAADFDRTPILMPKSIALMKARSQEILNRKGSYEIDIYNPNNSHQITTSRSIPELNNTPSEKLKSLSNTKQHDKSLSASQDDSDSSIFKSEKEITVIRNPKFINREEVSHISDEQTVAINEGDKDEIKQQDDCKTVKSNTKPKDNTIKLWHDSLSSEEGVSGKDDWKELSEEKLSNEDVIITFDKCTTISTSLKPIITEEDFRKKEDVKGKKKKNIKVDIKVREEKEKFFTPENKRGFEVYENRTPLSNRSNSTEVQKRLSKGKTISIGTQENTPPCTMYNGKIRNGTQWDSNSTILI